VLDSIYPSGAPEVDPVNHGDIVVALKWLVIEKNKDRKYQEVF
jgi:hypothetical protein